MFDCESDKQYNTNIRTYASIQGPTNKNYLVFKRFFILICSRNIWRSLSVLLTITLCVGDKTARLPLQIYRLIPEETIT